MVEGLLWFDSDPKRGLADKVLAAAARYQEKHGQWPNMCMVHPGALAGVAESAKEHLVRRGEYWVQVLAAPNILAHHYWIGIGKGGDEREEVQLELGIVPAPNEPGS